MLEFSCYIVCLFSPPPLPPLDFCCCWKHQCLAWSHCVCDRLHKTQDLLYDSTKDFLEQRYQGRADERSWMGEKDKLLQQLDRCKSQLSAGTHNHNNNFNVSVTSHDGRTASAEELKVAGNFVFWWLLPDGTPLRQRNSLVSWRLWGGGLEEFEIILKKFRPRDSWQTGG